jgi:hypothetical protein
MLLSDQGITVTRKETHSRSVLHSHSANNCKFPCCCSTLKTLTKVNACICRHDWQPALAKGGL